MQYKVKNAYPNFLKHKPTIQIDCFSNQKSTTQRYFGIFTLKKKKTELNN